MTKIIAVIDESGSMNTKIDQTISGFSEFMQKMVRDHSEASLTLIKFNDRITTVYTNKPVTQVQSLDIETYTPHGMTALYDAVGEAAKLLSDEQTIVVIITDGEENSSKNYTNDEIKTIIKHLEATEKWSFIFLAENMKVHQQAQRMGVTDTLSYEGDTKTGYGAAFLSVSNKIKGRNTWDGLERVSKNVAGVTQKSTVVNQRGKTNINLGSAEGLQIGDNVTQISQIVSGNGSVSVGQVSEGTVIITGDNNVLDNEPVTASIDTNL